MARSERRNIHAALCERLVDVVAEFFAFAGLVGGPVVLIIDDVPGEDYPFNRFKDLMVGEAVERPQFALERVQGVNGRVEERPRIELCQERVLSVQRAGGHLAGSSATPSRQCFEGLSVMSGTVQTDTENRAPEGRELPVMLGERLEGASALLTYAPSDQCK